VKKRKTNGLKVIDLGNASEHMLRSKIDWIELRAHKAELLNIRGRIRGHETREALDGVIHLIDALQDHAVDHLGVAEEEVFGNLGDFC